MGRNTYSQETPANVPTGTPSHALRFVVAHLKALGMTEPEVDEIDPGYVVYTTAPVELAEYINLYSTLFHSWAGPEAVAGQQSTVLLVRKGGVR